MENGRFQDDWWIGAKYDAVTLVPLSQKKIKFDVKVAGRNDDADEDEDDEDEAKRW